MSAPTYRRASGLSGRSLKPYLVCTTKQLSSLVYDSQLHVTQWLDTTPFSTHSLVSNNPGMGSPMLNLNVDGYAALELPRQSNGSNLRDANGRPDSPETFVFYVRLKLSDALTLATTPFGANVFGVSGLSFGNNSVAVASDRTRWHSIIWSVSTSAAFLLLDGVVYPIPTNSGVVGYYQLINYLLGSAYVRYLASYDRAATPAEALGLHQKLLADFPAVPVAPRFATPAIASLSTPQSETQKYFVITKDAAYGAQDYAVSYNSGDSFVPLPTSAAAGATVQVPLPAAFYFPGEVCVKKLSTLARPESLLATHSGVLGFVNYLYDSYFAQGTTYWSVQDVVIASNAATWQKDGGSLFQGIPGHTMQAGYQYKIQVTGTGSFHINKNEDYYGGQPNTDFTLTNGQTLEFSVGYGDVNHSMYLTLTGTAGSVLTRVTWTLQ